MDRLQQVLTTVQIVSIAGGLMVSVMSFSAAQQAQATARQVEAAKPFNELRQKVYVEAIKVIAVIVNPKIHTAAEIQTAKARFRDLYVAELTMVEDVDVASGMVALARSVDPDLVNLDPAQSSALHLARTMGESFKSRLPGG